MKAFAAAALATVAAASAAPEAQWLAPAAWAPATGSAVAGLVAHPNGGVTPPLTPAVAAATADHLNTKAATYAAHGFPALPVAGIPALPVAGIWKREAEAEAEPWLGYGLGGWGLAGVAGPKSAPCVNAANIPVPCRGPWKREADAEAEPWLGYAAPYAYAAAPAVGSPVAGLVAHPNGAVTPPYTPAQQAVAADHFARRGGVWWGKRSAEAEPWLGYGYGLAGWGLAGWGPAGIAAPKSAPCVNSLNIPVPC